MLFPFQGNTPRTLVSTARRQILSHTGKCKDKQSSNNQTALRCLNARAAPAAAGAKHRCTRWEVRPSAHQRLWKDNNKGEYPSNFSKHRNTTTTKGREAEKKGTRENRRTSKQSSPARQAPLKCQLQLSARLPLKTRRRIPPISPHLQPRPQLSTRAKSHLTPPHWLGKRMQLFLLLLLRLHHRQAISRRNGCWVPW